MRLEGGEGKGWDRRGGTEGEGRGKERRGKGMEKGFPKSPL